MDLNKLRAKKHTTIHSEDVDGSMLVVKESAEYRWFEYGGQDMQSLMSLHQPEQLFTPVSQSLLFFILWKSKPLKVLNLGLGGASFERTLSTLSSILLTSVEVSQPIIEMAKQYFKLPKKVHVICESAENFIHTTQNKYDVVLCDMFFKEKSPDFLFSEHFYAQLKQITLSKSVVIVNLQAETDEQLLLALFEIKKSFPYIALIDFNDYKNIVIIGSDHEIPAREFLQEQLANIKSINLHELEKIIPRIRYIPHTTV